MSVEGFTIVPQDAAPRFVDALVRMGMPDDAVTALLRELFRDGKITLWMHPGPGLATHESFIFQMTPRSSYGENAVMDPTKGLLLRVDESLKLIPMIFSSDPSGAAN